MNSLYCKCLNIKIKSDNFLDNGDNTISEDLILFSKEILPKDSYITYLKNCALTLKNDFLSQEMQIDDWLVTMCLNCSMITHAISIFSSDKKIENQDLKSDGEFIIIASNLLKIEDEQFLDDKSYSQLYNILLQKPHDPQINTSDSNSSETIINLQKIQEKFDVFLAEEYDKLEVQIKKFEENERAAFEKLKEKVRLEKNAIISTYLSSSKFKMLSKLKYKDNSSLQVATPSIINQMNIKSPSNKFKHHVSDVILEESSENEEYDQTYKTIDIDSTYKTINLESTNNQLIDLNVKNSISIDNSIENTSYIDKEINKNEVKKLSPLSTSNNNNQNIDNLLNVEDVFQCEIDDTYRQPFSESDNESKESYSQDNGTDDEGITSERDFSSYSTSVPVSIPFQRQSSHKSQESDSSSTFHNDAANDQMMAASIQALARSVCANDTLDIFGELPKSRTRKTLLTSISSTEDD